MLGVSLANFKKQEPYLPFKHQLITNAKQDHQKQFNGFFHFCSVQKKFV
jgi:hypothetical protein